MGKALILSDQGAGLYTVKAQFDRDAIAARVAVYDRALTNVEELIAKEQDKQEPSQAVLTGLQARKDALTRARDNFQALYDDEPIHSAWCVDLTPGLTGEVGTIEPGAELKNGINIQPGADGEAGFSRERDGQLTKFMALGPFNAALNFALMPAIQKYKPTYRYGTLTGIDYGNNTCTVALDAVSSSQQSLNINQTGTLSNVPIEYMTCDAQAFTLDDKVVVKFENFDQSEPKVIGFQSNPKACGYILKVNTINGITKAGGWAGNSYKLALIQRIETEITDSNKGTYTEDFVVVGTATKNIDAKGVAEIELTDGVEIDPTKPLYVAIRNYTKGNTYTEDWRGNIPQYGVRVVSGVFSWTTYPEASALGDYDYLLDSILWRQTDIDLFQLQPSSFENNDGETLTGYVVDIPEFKILEEKYTHYKFCPASCAYSGVQPYPIDEDEIDAQTLQRVDDDLGWDYIEGQNTSWSVVCYDSPQGTAVCDANGETGATMPLLAFSQDSVTNYNTVGDPGLLCDRLGQNFSFVESKIGYEFVADCECYSVFVEEVWGYNDDGQHVYCPSMENTGSCGSYTYLHDEIVDYKMLDITEDYL